MQGLKCTRVSRPEPTRAGHWKSFPPSVCPLGAEFQIPQGSPKLDAPTRTRPRCRHARSRPHLRGHPEAFHATRHTAAHPEARQTYGHTPSTLRTRPEAPRGSPGDPGLRRAACMHVRIASAGPHIHAAEAPCEGFRGGIVASCPRGGRSVTIRPKCGRVLSGGPRCTRGLGVSP